jgi:hypothetical protein
MIVIVRNKVGHQSTIVPSKYLQIKKKTKGSTTISMNKNVNTNYGGKVSFGIRIHEQSSDKESMPSGSSGFPQLGVGEKDGFEERYLRIPRDGLQINNKLNNEFDDWVK